MSDQKQPAEGSTLYYSLWRVPQPRRDHLYAVLRLFGTLAGSLHDVTDPAVAEQKIHWWHEEIDRLGQGNPRHPDTRAVEPILRQQQLPAEHLLDILKANNQEKFSNPQTDLELTELLRLDYGTRLRFWEGIVLGKQIETTPSDLDNVWSDALGQTERLRQLRYLHNRAYPVFPQSSYEQFALTPDQLLQSSQETAVRALLDNRLALASSRLEESLDSTATVVNRSPALRIYMTLRHRQLTLWQKKPLQLLHGYTTLTPLKKFWTAWRLQRQN